MANNQIDPAVHDGSREKWSGKWMFILAAAGSAVGLGNMWRFPYLDAKYGGGTFLAVYLILVFTIGISMLIQELALGRHSRKSVIGAFTTHGKGYGIIGILASAVPFIIFPYYCVIGGWVAKYVTAVFSDGVPTMADGGGFFVAFITGNVESYVYALIFGIAVLLIVAMGVKGGIEKVNLVLMPALILMAIGIAIYTLTIPGAMAGLAYYLTPDFSKLSPELLLAAVGQCFFSMSLAMAIMVTYGSYVEREESLTESAGRIAGFDLLVSFLAGLMIVPGAVAALGSAEAVASSSGPSLMFITLPTVFENMGAAGPVIAFVFFLLALFAALTSAISIAEACVSIICDGIHCTRLKGTVIFTIYAIVMMLLVNAGYNVLSFIEPLGAGSSMLDLFDFVSNTVLMPVVGILTCLFVGWIMKPETLIEEIRISAKFALAKPWAIMIKFVCPIVIAIVGIAYVMMTFGMLSL